MMIWSGIVLGLIMICVPAILGSGFYNILGIRSTMKTKFVFGWFIMLALFEIITVPLTFAERSLVEVTYIYTVCIGLLCCFCLGRCIWGKKIAKSAFNNSRFNLYVFLALVVFVLQIVIAAFGMHMDTDDAYYIGMANTSLSTDTLFLIEPDTGYASYAINSRYAFSAIMVFWAFLSKITGIHPLIITHTIVPVIFISISYILWWEIGKLLFKDQEKQGIFFLLINVLNIFGNTSIYTQASFLLFRIWQGKAMLPNIILPAILLTFLQIYQYPKRKRIWFAVLIIVCAACCCSSMAVPLGMIVVAAASCVIALLRRRWKFLVYGFLCCIPCLTIGIAYLILQ